MRYHSYLNTAKNIIENYKGEIPFAVFIKKYFSAKKKYGSKDRKQITALCYNYFRLGKALPQLPIEEKIIIAVFLCERDNNAFLQFHKPNWNEIINNPLEEKCIIANVNLTAVFPYADELSAGIDSHVFNKSFFYQPDLFLRIRPGKKNNTLNKIHEAGINFKLYADDCIALPNAVKVDTIVQVDIEVVVQDYNSQNVLDILKENKHKDGDLQVWDCCAASGGKSILAYDILQGKIKLTVSDIRESILNNLKKRFKTANIKNYQSFIVDLAAQNCQLPLNSYQFIICDAPCTGSGTWSRTPEQLYLFKKKIIDDYSLLQKKIVSNVIPQLKPGGLFVYITCSVFKKENEDVVNHIKEKFNLQLLKMQLLLGYHKKADSMFVAVFKN